MRVADLPYFDGLTLAEQQLLIFQAAAEQQKEITGLFNQLFAETAQAVEEANRPLTYFTKIARENRKSLYPSPADFWKPENQAARGGLKNPAASPLGVIPPPKGAATLRPGFGTALSPLEYAQGKRQGPTIQPVIGLPPLPKIQTFDYESLFTIGNTVAPPTGQIVDVFA